MEKEDKYSLMGVTPKELYLRQSGKCWLTLAYDMFDGVEVPGELYCTDGKEYAITGNMLNPTFECMKCISSFILKESSDKMAYTSKINSIIIDLLQAIGKATEYSEDKPKIILNKNTLNSIEEFLSVHTVAMPGKEALRFESGKLVLFGVGVDIDGTIRDNVLNILPNNVELNIKL